MRAGYVLALAIVLAALSPHSAAAIWNQPRFAIGGYRAGGEPDKLLQLNNAGIDYVVSFDFRFLDTASSLLARFDSLSATNPGFRTRDFVMTELWGDPVAWRQGFFKNIDPFTNESYIKQALSRTNSPKLNSTSAAGWFIWDEPPLFRDGNVPSQSTRDSIYLALHKMTTIIRDSSATSDSTWNRPALVNLIQLTSPAAYNFFQPGCPSDTLLAYQCYLDRYLAPFNSDALPAPILSFDAYPFEGACDSGTNNYCPLWYWYFMNLATVRDKSMEYGRRNYRIPFWSVIQASPRHEAGAPQNYRWPTFNQTRWQAYVSMAYGAKGIFYWTLREVNSGPGNTFGYGPSFMKLDGTWNSPLADSLAALNGEMKSLGATLMQLDPVATYHASSNGFKLPTNDVLSSPNRIYNIVTGITAVGTNGSSNGNTQGMFGYLKARSDGADYLLVVNKDTLVTQGFTVTLGNVADSVYRVRKTDGQLSLVTANAGQFSTGMISPGGGELFRIIDQTYEYIPNVKTLAIRGDTTYYGHAKGIVMVVRGTARRMYYNDDNNYTPVTDLSVTNSHVFAVQDNGTNGNIAKLGLDLSNRTYFYLTRPKAVSASLDESRIVVAEPTTVGGLPGSNVKVFDNAGTLLTTLAFNNLGAPSTPWIAYDVQYQEGLNSFVVAHGRYYSRYQSVSPFALITRTNYRTPAPTNVRLAALGTGTSQLLFAGRDDGTIGGVEKLDYNVTRPPVNGWWPAGGTEPSVKGVAAAGNHVLFGSTSPTGDYFVQLRAIDLFSYVPYRATTLPTAVALTSDSIAFMANGPGVARSSQSNLSGRFLLAPAGSDRSGVARDSSQASLPTELALGPDENPVSGRAIIRFAVPARGRANLAVFDVQGRQLARLLDSTLEPGYYTTSWTPPAHRVVFVRLRVGEQTRTQKMVVR
jgi:hypothetical protein